jgi:hypothetical protein
MTFSVSIWFNITKWKLGKIVFHKIFSHIYFFFNYLFHYSIDIIFLLTMETTFDNEIAFLINIEPLILVCMIILLFNVKPWYQKLSIVRFFTFYLLIFRHRFMKVSYHVFFKRFVDCRLANNIFLLKLFFLTENITIRWWHCWE